jgi:hypothetical protein
LVKCGCFRRISEMPQLLLRESVICIYVCHHQPINVYAGAQAFLMDYT